MRAVNRMNKIEWKNMYQCEFISTEIEEIDVPIYVAISKYNIDKSEIGVDRGIMFNRVAMKVDHNGNYKAMQYLPRNENSIKKNIDFYINII